MVWPPVCPPKSAKDRSSRDLTWNPHLSPALSSTRPLSLKPTCVLIPRCLPGLLRQRTTDTHALTVFVEQKV